MSRWLAGMVLALTLHTPAFAKENIVHISITVNNQTITAIMDNSASAQDFISLLPMTVTLDDYANTEKVSDLPRKLTKQGAPTTITPKRGDITSYTPWGNLAIFYRDGHDSPGLVKLGHIDSGMDALEFIEPQKATIELLKP